MVKEPMSCHTGTEAHRRAPKAVPHIGIAVHLIQYMAVHLVYGCASHIWPCISDTGVHLIYRRAPHTCVHLIHGLYSSGKKVFDRQAPLPVSSFWFFEDLATEIILLDLIFELF